MKRPVEAQLEVPKAMLVVNVADEFPTYVEISPYDGEVSKVEVRSPSFEATRDALAICMAMAEAILHAMKSRTDLAIALTKFEKLNGASNEEAPFE